MAIGFYDMFIGLVDCRGLKMISIFCRCFLSSEIEHFRGYEDLKISFGSPLN